MKTEDPICKSLHLPRRNGDAGSKITVLQLTGKTPSPSPHTDDSVCQETSIFSVSHFGV